MKIALPWPCALSQTAIDTVRVHQDVTKRSSGDAAAIFSNFRLPKVVVPETERKRGLLKLCVAHAIRVERQDNMRCWSRVLKGRRVRADYAPHPIRIRGEDNHRTILPGRPVLADRASKVPDETPDDSAVLVHDWRPFTNRRRQRILRADGYSPQAFSVARRTA